MIRSRDLQNKIQTGDKVTFCFEDIDKNRIDRRNGVWVFDGYKNCNIDCSCFTWCKGKMKFHQDEFRFAECLIYISGGGRRSPVVLREFSFLENELFEI